MVRVMDWQIGNFLIGSVAIAFTITAIVMRAVGRPLMPRLVRLMTAYPNHTAVVFSILMIVWGGGIWYLLISKNDYSNTLAMIMASLVACTGIGLLIISILRKND
jgi:predicted neutral ceramidase superfamily lipid hydrolase